jgi:hypothetical protein
MNDSVFAGCITNNLKNVAKANDSKPYEIFTGCAVHDANSAAAAYTDSISICQHIDATFGTAGRETPGCFVWQQHCT